jgi:hypothetical protein
VRTAEEAVKQQKKTSVGKRSPLELSARFEPKSTAIGKKEKAASIPARRPYPCSGAKFRLRHHDHRGPVSENSGIPNEWPKVPRTEVLCRNIVPSRERCTPISQALVGYPSVLALMLD